MALIIGVLNCTKGSKGTGTAGCKIDPNNINNLIFARKGFSLDATSDSLDQEDFEKLVQDGTLVVLPAHFGREDASEEYVYETSEIGVKIKVRPGNIEMVVTYAAGICFSKALETLASKKFDLLFTDYEDGKSRLWGAFNNGKFKGFDLALNNAENFQLPTGSTGAKKPLRIQFSPKGTVEYNSMMDFVTSDDVDFAAYDGINDVILSSTDNTTANFLVSVTSGCDKTTNFEGFADPKFWKVTNSSGATQTVTGVTYADGKYKLAGLSAGTYNVQLYDTTEGLPVAAVDGMFYQSDVLNVVLTGA